MRVDKRTFLYSASVMALSNIGLQILGFVYRVALSRLAGAEGLGVYRLVFSVYTVINAASLSGVVMACSRLSSTKNAVGKPEQLRPLARLATGVFLVVFALCTAIVIPFHDYIASTLLGDDRTAAALPVMLICLFLTGFENIIKALFVGTGRVQYAAISETGEQIIRFAAVVSLLHMFGGKDYGRIAALIMLGMALSECFSVGFLGILYRKHIASIGRRGYIKADPGLWRSMAEIAVPLSIAAIFINIIASAEAVILPMRLTASGMTYSEALSALGVISGMATPLILLPIALVSAVGTVLVPSIAAAQSRGDNFRVRTLTDKALTVTGLLAIPATTILLPLSPSLARVFFAQSIPLPYMALLSISAILSYYQMMTASLLHGIGAQRRAVIAAVCGECLQLSLTWVLAARGELQIYGYILAMIIGPIPVILFNLYGLWTKTGYKPRWAHTLGIPLLCSATLYFWVRVFYSAFLGLVGAQWQAIVLTLCCAAVLYFGLLQMLGIQVHGYIMRRMIHPDRLSMYGFF